MAYAGFFLKGGVLHWMQAVLWCRASPGGGGGGSGAGTQALFVINGLPPKALFTRSVPAPLGGGDSDTFFLNKKLSQFPRRGILFLSSSSFPYIPSVESQKGVIAAQRCSVENQKGRYCCAKSMAIAPFWFLTEHLWSAIAPFWLSADDTFFFLFLRGYFRDWVSFHASGILN